jgi:hypothetical protein
MIEGLRLRFHDDGDSTGKLHVEVSADGFCAQSAAYFSISELQAFARSLIAFPLPEQPRLKIAGGFWSKTDPAVLEDVLLSIEVYPVGARGQVGVRVHSESEIWPGDREESRNEATVELLTTYAQLGAFSREMLALISQAQVEAVLGCERLT